MKSILDSELPGAAPRLMASGMTGSSPVGSASGNVLTCTPSQPMIYSRNCADASPWLLSQRARRSWTTSTRSRWITSLIYRRASYWNSDRVAKRKQSGASTPKLKPTRLQPPISACRGLGIRGLCRHLRRGEARPVRARSSVAERKCDETFGRGFDPHRAHNFLTPCTFVAT